MSETQCGPAYRVWGALTHDLAPFDANLWDGHLTGDVLPVCGHGKDQLVFVLMHQKPDRLDNGQRDFQRIQVQPFATGVLCVNPGYLDDFQLVSPRLFSKVRSPAMPIIPNNSSQSIPSRVGGAGIGSPNTAAPQTARGATTNW